MASPSASEPASVQNGNAPASSSTEEPYTVVPSIRKWFVETTAACSSNASEQTKTQTLTLRQGMAGILDCRRGKINADANSAEENQSSSANHLLQLPFSLHIPLDEFTGGATMTTKSSSSAATSSHNGADATSSADSPAGSGNKEASPNPTPKAKTSDRWCELPPRHLVMGLLLDTEEDILPMKNSFCQGNMKKWEIELVIAGSSRGPGGNINDGNDGNLQSSGDGDANDDGNDSGSSNFLADVKWAREGVDGVEGLKRSDDENAYDWVLWRPNPLLEDSISMIEEKLLSRGASSEAESSGKRRKVETDGDHDEKHADGEGVSSNSSTSLTALDLGCGSGRDLVFLGRRNQPWLVTGIDHLPKAVKRAESFAKIYKLEKKCRFLTAKLERLFEQDVQEKLTGILEDQGKLNADVDNQDGINENGAQYDLVIVCRTILDDEFDIDRLLKPGGVVLYHHFMEGCSHPNRGLKKTGELRKKFEERLGYEVLLDEVKGDLCDGRPLSFFVGRKGVGS